MAEKYFTPDSFGTINEGDTIVLAPGLYKRTLEVLTNEVIIRAEEAWKSIFDGSSARDFGILNNGNKNSFYGLGITEFNNGIWTGPIHTALYSNCHIHTIGKKCTGTSSGLDGFNDKDQTESVEISYCVIHNIGRYHPGENGCQDQSGNDRNHDHGIYLRGQNCSIHDNVIYDCDSGWCIQAAKGASGAHIYGNMFALPNPHRNGHIVLWNRQTDFLIENNASIDARNAFIQLTGDDPCDKVNIVIRENIMNCPKVVTPDCQSITLENNEVMASEMIFTAPTGPLLHSPPVIPPISEPTPETAPKKTFHFIGKAVGGSIELNVEGIMEEI